MQDLFAGFSVETSWISASSTRVLLLYFVSIWCCSHESGPTAAVGDPKGLPIIKPAPSLVEPLSRSCPGVSVQRCLCASPRTYVMTRWSEPTPSLHFTFSQSNHPQLQPQQRHEWYYSYRCAKLWFFSPLYACCNVPLHSLLLNHTFGKKNFSLLVLFLPPPAPHAALLEILLCLPADMFLNQPPPPHYTQYRYSPLHISPIHTHRKWYFPQSDHN